MNITMDSLSHKKALKLYQGFGEDAYSDILVVRENRSEFLV